MFRFVPCIAVLALCAVTARAGPLGDWHPDAESLCLVAPYDQAGHQAQADLVALLAAIEALDPSPDPLLAVLRRTGAAICVEDRPTTVRGAYNVDSNLIELRADLDFGERLLILIHELRHLDQYDHGFCPSTDFDLREIQRFTFMVEADAQAIATYYAWMLRQAGRAEAWDAIARLKEYADIGDVFADSIAHGDAPVMAVGAAFDAWFTSPWRVETYRMSSCTAYLDRLDDSKRIRSYALLPEDYFTPLCRLPDGMPYPCAAPE